MSPGKHPVDHRAVVDPATGRCAHEGCDRAIRLYPSGWQHLRGFGGQGGLNPRQTRAHQQIRRDLADAMARIALLEADNARLRRENQPWVGLHAKLDRIIRNQERPVTHRRQADGGIGGRAERDAA